MTFATGQDKQTHIRPTAMMLLALQCFFLSAVFGSAAFANSAAQGADAGKLYEVQGVKLYVEVSGTGPPLVFLHGGLGSFDAAFAQQKDYFSALRTVIGIDQRGHGHSPDNERPFSYREMADNTAALIQKLGLISVDLVGHSDGGNVALLLARFHPKLVRRVVVSGANISGDYNGMIAYARFRLTSDKDFAARLSPRLRDAYVRISPDGDRHWLSVVAKTKELWSTWRVLDPTDLAAIRVPVLVIAGDRDVVSLEHTIAIFRGLPMGQLCILPRTGHMTMQERSDDFNRLVREFLERPDEDFVTH